MSRSFHSHVRDSHEIAGSKGFLGDNTSARSDLSETPRAGRRTAEGARHIEA